MPFCTNYIRKNIIKYNRQKIKLSLKKVLLMIYKEDIIKLSKLLQNDLIVYKWLE